MENYPDFSDLEWPIHTTGATGRAPKTPEQQSRTSNVDTPSPMDAAHSGPGSPVRRTGTADQTAHPASGRNTQWPSPSWERPPVGPRTPEGPYPWPAASTISSAEFSAPTPAQRPAPIQRPTPFAGTPNQTPRHNYMQWGQQWTYPQNQGPHMFPMPLYNPSIPPPMWPYGMMMPPPPYHFASTHGPAYAAGPFMSRPASMPSGSGLRHQCTCGPACPACGHDPRGDLLSVTVNTVIHAPKHGQYLFPGYVQNTPKARAPIIKIITPTPAQNPRIDWATVMEHTSSTERRRRRYTYQRHPRHLAGTDSD